MATGFGMLPTHMDTAQPSLTLHTRPGHCAKLLQIEHHCKKARFLSIKSIVYLGQLHGFHRRGRQLLLAKVKNADGRIGIFLY